MHCTKSCTAVLSRADSDMLRRDKSLQSCMLNSFNPDCSQPSPCKQALCHHCHIAAPLIYMRGWERERERDGSLPLFTLCYYYSSALSLSLSSSTVSRSLLQSLWFLKSNFLRRSSLVSSYDSYFLINLISRKVGSVLREPDTKRKIIT